MKRLFAVLACLALLAIAAAAQTGSTPVPGVFSGVTLALAQPPQPVSSATGVVEGNPGPRILYYWIVTNALIGSSAPSGPFIVPLAPNTLTASNSVSLSWAAAPGAITYDVLRTTSPAAPVGACNCAVATAVTGTTASDQSNTLAAYTVAQFDPNTLAWTLSNQSAALGVSKLTLSVAGQQKWSIDSTGVQTSAGLNAQTIEQVRYADQFSGASAATQVSAAESSLGGNGLVILPSNLQQGNCGYTSQPPSDLLDFRTGMTQTANLSFFCDPVFLSINDNSARTTNSAAQGDSAIAPILHLEGVESGGATLGGLYEYVRGASGATGSLYGMISATDASAGWRGGGVSQNFVTGLDQEFHATASRSSNVVTLTITSGSWNFAVGDFVHVSGCSDSSFDSGAFGFTLSTAGAATVTYSQTAANSTATGCDVALGASFWSLEVDAFNDSRDPTVVTATVAQNNTLVHGITSTSNGTYPLSDGFFEDSSSAANTPYEGFLGQDAKDAIFRAGYNTGSTPLQAHTGFLASEECVATSSSNCNSLAVGFKGNGWYGGTGSETAASTIQLVLSSGANPTQALEFTVNGTEFFNLTESGLVQFPTWDVGGFGDTEVTRAGPGVLDVAGKPVAIAFSATTSSIGGAPLAAGACTTGTVAVASSTTSMAVAVSPAADPGTGFTWQGWVSAAGTVTVRLCNVTSGSLTPTAEAYNVRVIQ